MVLSRILRRGAHVILLRPICWFKGHDWEHRVFFIIMHYWRCKRCGKQAEFNSFPDDTRQIYEAEKLENARREEEYQRQRYLEDKRWKRSWRCDRWWTVKKVKRFMSTRTYDPVLKKMVKKTT